MSGLLIRHAPHLDGSEDIGVWLDVAWSVYLEVGIELSKFNDGTTSVDEMWDALTTESTDGKPTPEEWGTSIRAQQGQDALMSMFGGGPMGAAPSVGEEG